MNQAADAVVVGGRLGHDPIHGESVARFDAAAGAKRDELAGQAPREGDRIGREQRPQFVRPGECPAVGQFARGIDRLRVFIGDRVVPIDEAFRGLPLLRGAVAVAKLSSGIEGLECEAGRIDLAVAARAGL